MNEIANRIAKHRWYHPIDLGDDVVTPGVARPQTCAFKADFTLKNAAGKSVLDVGAWDGYYSFAAERRGASRVLATDHFCWVGKGWGKIDGFLTARDILNSKVDYQIIDAAEISRETVGEFDIVMFLGVLYHLKEPFAVLERVTTAAKNEIIVETETALDDLEFPAARFFPRAELGGDATNWWAPNRLAVAGMLDVCGFDVVEVAELPMPQTPQRGRLIFRAKRRRAGG